MLPAWQNDAVHELNGLPLQEWSQELVLTVKQLRALGKLVDD